MLGVDKKQYERVIVQIITLTDLREILREFSLYRVFYHSLLKDIVGGKNSPNYAILKRIAREKKISEQFIIEQAALVLSHLASEEPKEDYYKILDVSPEASAEEIRRSWISLLKVYHPDHSGEAGLDATKKLNKAYEELGDPIKRRKYDARRIPALPVMVRASWVDFFPRRVVLFSLTILISVGLVFYLTKSGLVPKSAEVIRESIQKAEDRIKHTLFESEFTGASLNPNVERNFPPESGQEAVERAPALSKKRRAIPVHTEKSRPEKIPEETERANSLGGLVPDSVNDLKSDEHIASDEDSGKGAKLKEEFTGTESALDEGEGHAKAKRTPNTEVKHLKGSQKIDEEKVKSTSVSNLLKTKAGSTAHSETEMTYPEKSALVRETPPSNDEKSVKTGLVVKQLDSPTQYFRGAKSAYYPDRSSLNSFVAKYISAYQRRDMAAFLSLFEPDARENGVQISNTLPKYAENFSSLEVIKYDVEIKRTDFAGQRAHIIADFSVVFRDRIEKEIRSSFGSINWLLSWSDNSWKIKEIDYEVRETR